MLQNAVFYHTWLQLTDREVSSVMFETHQFDDIGGTLYIDLRLVDKLKLMVSRTQLAACGEAVEACWGPAGLMDLRV